MTSTTATPTCSAREEIFCTGDRRVARMTPIGVWDIRHRDVITSTNVWYCFVNGSITRCPPMTGDSPNDFAFSPSTL